MLFRVCCLVSIIILMIGCATPNMVSFRSDDERNSSSLNYPIDPYTTMGIIKSDAIERGNFIVFLGIFPDGMFAEYDRLRIRYSGYASDDLGREYRVQSLFSGYRACQLRLVMIVEGVSDARGLRLLTLSTLTDSAYDLSGKPIDIGEGVRFSDLKKTQRLAIAKSSGTLAETVPIVDGFQNVFHSWNTFDTPGGRIFSPIGEKEMKLIARHNPQYSFLEKIVGNGSFSVSPDWISTAVGLAIESLLAQTEPSRGFDRNSAMPSREYMGAQITHLYRLMQIGQKECHSSTTTMQP